MVSEWRETALASVAVISSGKRPARVLKEAAGDCQIPVIGGGGPSGYTDSALFDGGVLITGRVGTLGKLFAPTGPCWPSDNALVVRPNSSETDPRFLRYALQQVIAEAVGMNRGAANPLITQGDLGRLSIGHPSLPEQRAIAHILGTLDDKTELNRRMSETLEAMARTLFKSWFVDFDPVRAKAEGRNPGLPQPLADLFPARLVNSELGEIPDEWEVGMLGDVAALNPEVWSKQTRPPEINYVDLSNTKWGRIEAVTVHEAADAPSRAQRVLRAGDTIVGTVRPGNGSYAFISDDDLTGSTGFTVLRPNTPQHAQFVYLAATGTENIDALAHLADGGAYPAVRPEVVAATPAVHPDNAVLERFALASGPLLAKMARNERESRTLAALRDALLPKLISGDVRVKDAGGLMERARSC